MVNAVLCTIVSRCIRSLGVEPPLLEGKIQGLLDAIKLLYILLDVIFTLRLIYPIYLPGAFLTLALNWQSSLHGHHLSILLASHVAAEVSHSEQRDVIFRTALKSPVTRWYFFLDNPIHVISICVAQPALGIDLRKNHSEELSDKDDLQEKRRNMMLVISRR